MGTLIVGVIVAFLLGAVLYHLIKEKRSGNPCAGCSSHKTCVTAQLHKKGNMHGNQN